MKGNDLGPAEPAEAASSRFARKKVSAFFCIYLLLLQHSLARKGLAVFNRSAHSARPGKWQREREKAREMGDGQGRERQQAVRGDEA